jgi:hypothetical protein
MSYEKSIFEKTKKEDYLREAIAGAAGIGWALLQLYLAEEGKFQVARALDDPYPLYR